MAEGISSRPDLTWQVGRLIIRSRRHVWRGVAHALAAAGESILDWQLVSHLAHTGPCSQRALADGVAQHPAGVSRQLEELERKGLMRRARDPADRRRSVVALTGEGMRWYRRHQALVQRAVAEALGALGPAEQRQLRALLTKLLGEAADDIAARRPRA